MYCILLDAGGGAGAGERAGADVGEDMSAGVEVDVACSRILFITPCRVVTQTEGMYLLPRMSVVLNEQ